MRRQERCRRRGRRGGHHFICSSCRYVPLVDRSRLSERCDVRIETLYRLIISSCVRTAQGGEGITDQEEGVQLDLAEDILRILFEKDLKVTIRSTLISSFNLPFINFSIEEDKRVLCQTLNRIQIPDKVDDHKIQSIKLLIDHLRNVMLHYIPLLNTR